ncbi:MAG: nucleotidyltransferase domain-containing protein [Ignavibacteria bacterium]|nr:nucleotidyltransferase domain-containing protein [Ignavibacteria bacterium]
MAFEYTLLKLVFTERFINNVTYKLHMEQKDYKMEIVNELLKNNNHIRGIARKININHMMINRKIKDLERENVVDYAQEGKNKKYFLKKTVEAGNYVVASEKYKLNKLLKNYPDLRLIIESIQKNPKIKLAVLFGSYAKETAKKDSDIDIYIETKSSEIKKELNMIDSRTSIKIGEYNSESLLIKEIEKNHVIIKGVELYYEKNKFFE